MKPIVTKINIAAPPEIVRAKLLDFPSLEINKHPFIRSIKPIDPQKNPIDLVPGDKLQCDLDGRILLATIQENSPTALIWTGTVAGVLHGTHSFRFVSSDGGETTTLHHEELFTGGFSFLLGENLVARVIGQRAYIEKSYGAFNESFKKWVESRVDK